MLKELMTPHQLADYLVSKCDKTLEGLIDSGVTRDWDLCFFSEASARLGIPGFGLQVVQAFLERQAPDGRVPQDLVESFDEFHCKPFLAQALLAAVTTAGVKRRAAEALLPNLHRYLRYYDEHRRSTGGLYVWRSEQESGVNTNIELLHIAGHYALDNYTQFKSWKYELLPVDLNSYLVSEFLAMSGLYEIFGDGRAAEFRQRARWLADAVNERMWNSSLNMYANVNVSGEITLRLRAWTGLLPVLLGFAPRERVQSVINKYIFNDDEFLRPYGLASLSAQEVIYSQAAMTNESGKLVPNWRGPMWLLPNVLAVRALVRLGRRQDAVVIAERCLAALRKDLAETNGLHYSYDAETGKGLLLPRRIGWNVMALELIELIERQSAVA